MIKSKISLENTNIELPYDPAITQQHGEQGLVHTNVLSGMFTRAYSGSHA